MREIAAANAFPGKIVGALCLALIGVSAHAQPTSATSGDWIYAFDENMTTASTSNPDGSMFGIVCTDACINYIVSDHACAAGHQYDGTMLGANASFPVQMTCRHVEGMFVLVSRPTGDFIDLAAGGGEIGFSVSLDNVPASFRFSLTGAYDAIYAALQAAVANADHHSAAAASPFPRLAA